MFSSLLVSRVLVLHISVHLDCIEKLLVSRKQLCEEPFLVSFICPAVLFA
jgi:hypothetical protein